MKRILAVSPHLDDAVFSAGGTLAAHAKAGDVVTILTCFTGSVAEPTGFALACQLDKGLAADIDYMALRRAEDQAACATIGASPLHWSFLEAPHRGYDDAEALFAAPKPDDDAAGKLAVELRALLSGIKPDVIYGPFGIGNHVDHVAVRTAMEATISTQPIIWWEDYPYAMRKPAPPPEIERHSLADGPAERKLAATLCYKSQLGFQFGGAEEAQAALSKWNAEGLTAR